jgi:sulfite exporter TauE/SafE
MNHEHAISLTAAYIAGVAGSVHCFAMCGGMAGALGMRAREAGPRAAFLQSTLYQLGRIGGYALAGLLIGAVGMATLHVIPFTQLALVLRIASGVFIALVGLRLLSQWNPLHWLERGGAWCWSRVKPLVQLAANTPAAPRALALGFLWGWLPCGLVYSMLMFAGMSGSPVTGARIMLAFGLGTVPSMLTSSLLAARLQRFMSKRWPKVISGIVLLIFGAWMALAALGMQEAHVH